jgi:serine/threonine protein kinase
MSGFSYSGMQRMHFQIGAIVGDYEIIGVLGRGGMGKVFRVRNVLSHRVEAMKIVLPDSAANPDLADRFLREIRVHASLEHPHIAHLRTALRVENQVVMIIELVEGTSLDECLRQGRVDLRDGLRYVDQILSALEFAHSRGVIHRDIKPANIIVPPDGMVKLTDFGIARAPGDKTLTLGGVALGSSYYMSPEQVRAQPLDGRSDLYSVGVTLYEISTGKRPIDGESEYSILNAHLDDVPIPPVELRPDLPAPLNAVILRALAKNPADRFQTAGEFRDRLRTVGGWSGSSPSIQPLPGPPRDFDPVRLAEVESALAGVLGPISKHVVARAAQRCSSFEDLCRQVSEQIADARQRQSFLRAIASNAGAAAAAAATPVWDPAMLAAVKQALAVHVGPIAGVMVTRALRTSRSRAELCEKLAAEIPDEQSRKKFLRRLPS